MTSLSQNAQQATRNVFLSKASHNFTLSEVACMPITATPLTRETEVPQTLEQPTKRFYPITMNPLGPFLLPSTGNRLIIAATVYLTRYTENSALPYVTATEEAKFFT